METPNNQHIPFMLFNAERLKKLKRLRGIAKLFSKIIPEGNSLMERSGVNLSCEDYTIGALLSGLVYFLLFGGMLFVVSNTFKGNIEEALRVGVGAGFGLGFMFFFLMMTYPKTLAKKKADMVDRYLIYALKDFLMQISAGNSVYNACVEIANANYGQVSIEFEIVAKKIQTGMPVEQALEEIAKHNDSKYFKKVIWQLVNTIRAGASLKEALFSIINDLNESQKSKIIGFANELNLWSLIYMLFAVAIPSIGTTMMVILSAFGGANLSRGTFVLFLVICAFIQFAIIGFIKARRPVVD
ncbi:MAG: type II secretion system F family protein [Candidatus Woesearchaeota archaeon]|jgi:pilus assembly protein TadC